MFILHNIFFILFITTVQSTNITVQFATFPVDTGREKFFIFIFIVLY